MKECGYRVTAIDPVGAQLVGIDVRRLSALAFACGGALAAAGGTLVSTFLSFNLAIGIEFTMKALVVVIMAGRPITLGDVLNDADALIMAWHPGTMGGPALVDVLVQPR